MGYVGDFIAAIFVLAIIYVLVRPRSAAAELVTVFGDMLTAIVKAATDL